MNKKIAIIGAGHGALYAAKFLAEAGADVTVFEKSEFESISHDRTDCIEAKLFEETALPWSEGSYKGDPCSFIAPFSEKMLYVYTEEKARDITVERKAFAHMLIAHAKEKGAKFEFGKEVESLIVEDLAVKGIVVDGESIYADLVIDASGLMSPFRGQLPNILGITSMPKDDEVFNVYHASYCWKEGVEPPKGKASWKIYLKYLGKKGISWVNCERENDAAILIGMIGELKENDFEELFAQLKKDNPIIGDTLLRGGQFAPISVRYPASVLVAEGYALIGDSAFMTIPLLGSGLANAIRAGQYLAEEIIKADSVDINALWNYQVKYFKKIGAVSCVVDSVKRALLELDNAELKYIIESGIVTDDDVKAILNGGALNIKPADLIERFKGLVKARGALKTLLKYVSKGVHAASVSMMIPKEYSLLAVNSWSKKLDRIFK